MLRPIYLDYMATTPCDPEVINAMVEAMPYEGTFGNPASRTHVYGWQADEAIAIARGRVADVIGADERSIYWTSGATESVNLAIAGAARFYQRKGKHIVTTAIEHSCTLCTCSALESEGFDVTYVEPRSDGQIDVRDLRKAITSETVLLSIAHVNSELGTIHDVSAIGAITHKQGVLFHVDAAQSIGKVTLHVQNMHIDMCSLSAHKAYGPKGIGALYLRRRPRIHLQPLLHGKGFQTDVRPGTLPTHQIIGMGLAFKIAAERQEEDCRRIGALRDKLWMGIKDIDGVRLNGHLASRVAHNLNVSFEGVDGEALLLALDRLAVSTGSACASTVMEASHVLKALGHHQQLAHASIRFSLGRHTTRADIDETIELVRTKIHRLRN